MLRILGQVFLSILLIIIFLCVKCSIESKFINSDPGFQTALAKIKPQSQPLIDALENYHASKGYYPKSIDQLPNWDFSWNQYHYELSQLNRVYKSIECRQRMKEFQGWVAGISDYEKKYKNFRNECVSGYSEYALTSDLPNNSSWNRNTIVFAKFDSHTAQWGLSWCDPAKNSNGHCPKEEE